MFAWVLSLLVASAGPPTHIRMGSADGDDRSLTDTFDIAADGHVRWTSTVESTHAFKLTPAELDRLAHLERFDDDRELAPDPARRYSRVWFIVERGGLRMRLRKETERNRALADILLGGEVRDSER